MTTAREIRDAAETERHVLLAQAMGHHLDNARSELDRYAAEVAHIESVYTLRLENIPGYHSEAETAELVASLKAQQRPAAGQVKFCLCGANVALQPSGLWENQDGDKLTQDERRYCPVSGSHYPREA
jgi:hypothetical protein